MAFEQDSFGDSLIYDNGPTTLMQRLGYVKQLVFSRTKLEFRILWNKIFQKEDEELGWLLNPYRQGGSSRGDATMMSSFNKNTDETYQYQYSDVRGALGKERVTIYHRGLAKKGDTRRRRKEEKKSLGESALELARYMGMGVYMTSTSFPSPFLPVNDNALYDETMYYGGGQPTSHMYTMSKIW